MAALGLGQAADHGVGGLLRQAEHELLLKEVAERGVGAGRGKQVFGPYQLQQLPAVTPQTQLQQ